LLDNRGCFGTVLPLGSTAMGLVDEYIKARRVCIDGRTHRLPECVRATIASVNQARGDRQLLSVDEVDVPWLQLGLVERVFVYCDQRVGGDVRPFAHLVQCLEIQLELISDPEDNSVLLGSGVFIAVEQSLDRCRRDDSLAAARGSGQCYGLRAPRRLSRRISELPEKPL